MYPFTAAVFILIPHCSHTASSLPSTVSVNMKWNTALAGCRVRFVLFLPRRGVCWGREALVPRFVPSHNKSGGHGFQYESRSVKNRSCVSFYIGGHCEFFSSELACMDGVHSRNFFQHFKCSAYSVVRVTHGNAKDREIKRIIMPENVFRSFYWT